jgi:hypothetical protein
MTAVGAVCGNTGARRSRYSRRAGPTPRPRRPRWTCRARSGQVLNGQAVSALFPHHRGGRLGRRGRSSCGRSIQLSASPAASHTLTRRIPAHGPGRPWKSPRSASLRTPGSTRSGRRHHARPVGASIPCRRMCTGTNSTNPPCASPTAPRSMLPQKPLGTPGTSWAPPLGTHRRPEKSQCQYGFFDYGHPGHPLFSKLSQLRERGEGE